MMTLEVDLDDETGVLRGMTVDGFRLAPESAIMILRTIIHAAEIAAHTGREERDIARHGGDNDRSP